jgi:riboflavin synthase
MFTGIVEETGIVSSISQNRIGIDCAIVLDGSKIGDSICVNGVCLTITRLDSNSFVADISPETLKVTSFSSTKKGDIVNLERALTLKDRLGGHIVSGHIDTVGKITSLKKLDSFYEINISFNSQYNKYVVKKGSITINGVSLTIADVGVDFVTIALIPHTFDITVFKALKVGDNVNIEFDILAKYVEKNLLSTDNNNITMSFLTENGFA